MEDLISREQAIDALRTCYDTETITMDNGDEYINYGDAVGEIEQLPSLRSEIIYCKDCKHFVREDREEYTPYGFYNTYFNAFCDKHFDVDLGEFIDVKLDDFCSFADRREQDG